MLVDTQKHEDLRGMKGDGQPETQPEREELLGQPADQPSGGGRQPGAAPGAGQPRAPDGGWGWVVAAAVACSSIVMMAPAISFPFIFAAYLKELGEGTEAITTLTSICMCICSFAGLLCNKLFQRFSCRQIGLIGSVFYVVSQGPLGFATSYVHFILSSICAGIAYGLMMPATFTCFNSYFERRRTFAMGLVQLVVGLGLVGVPVVTERLVAALGFRKAQCVFAGSTLLIFPIMALMRPIKSTEEGVNVETSAAETGSPADEAKKGSKVDLVNEHFVQDLVKRKSIKEVSKTFQGSDETRENGKTVNVEMEKSGLLEKQSIAKNQQKKLKAIDHSTKPLPRVSICSISSMPFPDTPDAIRKSSPKSWWLTVVDLFDLRLLQDLAFANIVVGGALSFFVDLMFFTLLPLYLFQVGFSQEQSALCISAMGIADLVARFALAVVGACCVPSNRLLFLLSAGSSVLLRALYIFVSDFTAVMALSALLGFCKCFMLAIGPLVIADACSMDRFPAALGLQNVMGGILNLLFGSAIGKLRDVTGSFTWSFIALTVLGLICVIPWTLEMTYTALKKRGKSTNDKAGK